MSFSPSIILRPYVKEYFVVTVDKDVTNQVFYPSGYVDFAVNISDGEVVTIINGRAVDMPNVEVLGHLTSPTRLTIAGGTSVLIARIYPFASSLFFPNPISHFTNHSIDLHDVVGNESDVFYKMLTEAPSVREKVNVLDTFLVQKLMKNEKMQRKAHIIKQVCNDLVAEGEAFDIKVLSRRYGFSERYIQKLFIDVVGLTPRSLFSVQRFNKSLNRVLSTKVDLTSIAYDCGYYDQAHFIREFKKYTGLTPSEARPLLAIETNIQQAVSL
ncbi:MAG TPA: AraC family transcriptional regulator [Cyclobacteriaceae bacterium]